MAITQDLIKNTPIKVGTKLTPTETITGKHHIQNPNNRFSHIIKDSEFPGVKKAEIIVGQDTIYLPYYQNEISSIELPQNGPNYFITDNMSGCAFFIDKHPNGKLVVYHANSQLGSDEATMSVNQPSYQSREAVSALGTLYFNARSSYPGYISQKALYKTEYLKVVDKAMQIRMLNKEIPDMTGKHYLGATTIVGIRLATVWQFFYQNWMQVEGKVQVVYSTKFY